MEIGWNLPWTKSSDSNASFHIKTNRFPLLNPFAFIINFKFTKNSRLFRQLLPYHQNKNFLCILHPFSLNVKYIWFQHFAFFSWNWILKWIPLFVILSTFGHQSQFYSHVLARRRWQHYTRYDKQTHDEIQSKIWQPWKMCPKIACTQCVIIVWCSNSGNLKLVILQWQHNQPCKLARNGIPYNNHANWFVSLKCVQHWKLKYATNVRGLDWVFLCRAGIFIIPKTVNQMLIWFCMFFKRWIWLRCWKWECVAYDTWDDEIHTQFEFGVEHFHGSICFYSQIEINDVHSV